MAGFKLLHACSMDVLQVFCCVGSIVESVIYLCKEQTNNIPAMFTEILCKEGLLRID